MANVFVFLADGLEEVEALTPIDLLRRAGDDVTTVSIMGRKEIHGAHKIDVMADTLYEEEDFSRGDILVLPGGMPGTLNLGAYKPLTDMILDWNAKGKKIAAICAAPSIFGDLGILEGKEAVCYPGFEERLTGATIGTKSVAVAGNITTSRGLGTAIDFSAALITQLQNEEKAESIKKSIIYGLF